MPAEITENTTLIEIIGEAETVRDLFEIFKEGRLSVHMNDIDRLGSFYILESRREFAIIELGYEGTLKYPQLGQFLLYQSSRWYTVYYDHESLESPPPIKIEEPLEIQWYKERSAFLVENQSLPVPIPEEEIDSYLHERRRKRREEEEEKEREEKEMREEMERARARRKREKEDRAKL